MLLGFSTVASGQPQSVFLNTFGTLIDPPGNGEVSAAFNGSTPEADLEALTDFRVINNFTFSTTIFGSSSYIINTSSPSASIPDFRFTYLSGAASGQPVITGLLTTSPNGAMNLRGLNATSDFSFRIDVGTFDGFNGNFTADQTVGALGFTLGGNYSYVDGVTADYFGPDGVLLSKQTFSSNDANTLYAYTGHTRTGVNGISHVIVSFRGININSPIFGLDDIGFAPLSSTIPEPASYATLLLASIACYAGLRRRPRSGC